MMRTGTGGGGVSLMAGFWWLLRSIDMGVVDVSRGESRVRASY